MKTIAILLNSKSSNQHIDFAIRNILNKNNRVLLIFIQNNRLITFSDPYLLFQSSILYNQIMNKEKEQAKEQLNTFAKHIKQSLDIEICKMVVIGNENYKLECVLKTLGVETAIVEREKKMFGKKLSDKICDWGVVVINVPYT